MDRPDAEAWVKRGIALQDEQRHEDALGAFDRAIEFDPRHFAALVNRGAALHRLGRYEDAVASYDRALAIRPDHAQALYNRGTALQDLNRHAEALAAYDRAIELRPDYFEARWNACLARLTLGDFERGWEEHERRWRHAGARAARRLAQPLWRGKEDVSGRTMLLHAELGLGDTLQFCRYAPLVAARGARVVLEAPPPLKGLLAGLRGVWCVLAKGESLPAFDFHCPLLSLPRAFGTRLETVPAEVPYLFAAPERVARWRDRLGEGARLRVGLAWSGRPEYQNDRNRSLALQQLAALRAPGIQFVSLQKDIRAEDRDAFAASGDLLHFGADMDDTAALAALMHVVIAVDTSIAHLAGALGRPTWVLLSYAADWRWLLDRSDSPWYPTARLFRQPRIGDWQSVLRQVGAELSRLAP